MSMATQPTAGQQHPSIHLELVPEVMHLTDKASRPSNEDFYTIPPYANLPGMAGVTAAAMTARGLLYVVADGMGGAAKGELASRLAVRTLVEHYFADPDPDLRSSLWRAVRAANDAVYRDAMANPANQGMGTTLTALLLRESKVYFGHVGDTRLYRWRGQRLERLSRDHSLVQELVDRGTLTPEQARVHPERNRVLRVLGTGQTVDVDTGVEKLALGDTFLLTTDGLHNELSDAQISHIVSTSGREASGQLTQAALRESGGPDNITVVWVRVGTRSSGPANGGNRSWWKRFANPAVAALLALVGVGWWIRGDLGEQGGQAQPLASTPTSTPWPTATEPPPSIEPTSTPPRRPIVESIRFWQDGPSLSSETLCTNISWETSGFETVFIWLEQGEADRGSPKPTSGRETNICSIQPGDEATFNLAAVRADGSEMRETLVIRNEGED